MATGQDIIAGKKAATPVKATTGYVYSSASPKVAATAATNIAKTGTATSTVKPAATAGIVQAVTPKSSPTLAGDIATYSAIPAAKRTAAQNAALATDLATQARQTGASSGAQQGYLYSSGSPAVAAAYASNLIASGGVTGTYAGPASATPGKIQAVPLPSATGSRAAVASPLSTGPSTSTLTHAPTPQAPAASPSPSPSSLTGAPVGVGPGTVAAQVASDQAAAAGDQSQPDSGQAISGGTGNVGGMESPADTGSSLPSLSTLGLLAAAGVGGYYLWTHKKKKGRHSK